MEIMINFFRTTRRGCDNLYNILFFIANIIVFLPESDGEAPLLEPYIRVL